MKIEIIAEEPELMISYAHDGDAGADLKASMDGAVPSGQTVMVPTGVRVSIPKGYVGLIHPRSGLAAKHGITVLNSPGTIDAGYTGEVKVLLHNTGQDTFMFDKYDRIAQFVFQRVENADFVPVGSFEEFNRGSNGFGSTGVN